jgi:hypothetical protein
MLQKVCKVHIRELTDPNFHVLRRIFIFILRSHIDVIPKRHLVAVQPHRFAELLLRVLLDFLLVLTIEDTQVEPKVVAIHLLVSVDATDSFCVLRLSAKRGEENKGGSHIELVVERE